MKISPLRKDDFESIISDYLLKAFSFISLKHISGQEIKIETLNKKKKNFNATYNTVNKSNLFVTVFAEPPAPKQATDGSNTLTRANALWKHSEQNIKSDIEHCNGRRCTIVFAAVSQYQRQFFSARKIVPRPCQHAIKLYRDGKNTCHASLLPALV